VASSRRDNNCRLSVRAIYIALASAVILILILVSGLQYLGLEDFMNRKILISSIVLSLLFSLVACQSTQEVVVSPEERQDEIYFKYMVTPENINKRFGKSKETALYRAVRLNDKEAVKVFLENPRTNVYIKPLPLLRAAYDNKAEIVQMLINKGVRLNDKNANGYTALHLAVRKGHQEIVEMLLQAGANPNVKDKKGRTALMDASLRGNVEITRLLLQANANANALDGKSRSALIISSALDHTDVAKALLQNADINQRDKKGRSALTYAARNGNIEIVKDLIQRGAEFNLRGEDKVALDAAAMNGHSKVVTYLIQADKANRLKKKRSKK
tara:strand:+ start:7865 stop:8851 length:987 start_codon:yes stop_codon:yes gene_type:complete